MTAPEAQFARLTRLPPYVFSITSELKMAARRRGEDIIDFGMGNPDGPTPQHIVAKLVETVQRAQMPATQSCGPSSAAIAATWIGVNVP